SGAFTVSKNGGPTVILTPRTASDRTGKSVPQKTAKAMPINTKLLNRNAASRDRYDSISAGVRNCLTRESNSAVYATTTVNRKVKKNGPRPDWVNECTEEITPLRVMKVPNKVKQNASPTSARFHTLSMSLRSWIITECRYAVITSQGMNAAF